MSNRLSTMNKDEFGKVNQWKQEDKFQIRNSKTVVPRQVLRP